MKRSELEHVIRAAAAIAEDDEIIVGREKDRRFARDAIRYGLVDRATLLDRLANTAVEDSIRRRIGAFVVTDFAPNAK